MGATRGGKRWAECQICGKGSVTVRSRGRVIPLAELCDPCWNRVANDLAEEEGATAAPPPDPGPDDGIVTEPPRCRECDALIRVHPTNYDRWVGLSTAALPAVDVPARFRWRLVDTGAGLVAVRLRGTDPLDGDPVVPDHRMNCVPVVPVVPDGLAPRARHARFTAWVPDGR